MKLYSITFTFKFSFYIRIKLIWAIPNLYAGVATSNRLKVTVKFHKNPFDSFCVIE